MFGEINIPASGTGGRGGMRHTCGTTAAAGKAKAAKAAKVLACISSDSFVQYNPAKAQILISNMLLVTFFPQISQLVGALVIIPRSSVYLGMSTACRIQQNYLHCYQIHDLTTRNA
jgi:hypothetical protein